MAYFVGDFVASSSKLTSFNYGWGFYGESCVGDWICLNQAPFTSTGAAPSGCPDCEWDFSTKTGSTTQTGSYCSALISRSGSGSVMDYDVTDFWFANPAYDNAVGFSDAYLFSGTFSDYTLTNVIFFHYSSGSFEGWYFQAYNLPDYGIYQVYGDSGSASIYKPWITSYGQYYIYYYY
jgi:hypothetical protein